MNQKTRNAMIGTLLGDGWLEKHSESGRVMYRIKARADRLAYLEWLRGKLMGLNPSQIKSIRVVNQYYFYTEVRRDIGQMYSLFYPNGAKVVPKVLLDEMCHSMSLAIWYQEDGTLDRGSYHFNAKFATHCFSYNECQLLVKILHDNYQIYARVHKASGRGKCYYVIYVLAKSMDRFIKLVKPYIQKPFKYKIGR
jgi:hypothetical protein